MLGLPLDYLLLIALLALFGLRIVLVRAGAFLPRHLRLRRRGVDLLLAGKPVEAENCFRTALDLGTNVPESARVRLLVCLGDALMDQKRYNESRLFLSQALELVDPTGSGQGSLCNLLLAQHTEPEMAIEMADEAMRLQAQRDYSRAYGERWNSLFKDFYETKTWARKSRALAFLGRQIEAGQALDRALRIVEMSGSELRKTGFGAPSMTRLVLGNRARRHRQLTISVVHWQIGLAQLAMRDNVKAIEHFLITFDTDRRGKYRNLAQEQLNKLGYAGQTPKASVPSIQ